MRFFADAPCLVKIVLLIAITITYGKTLGRVYLPRDVQISGGSDDVPQTSPMGTIVVIDKDVSHEDIAKNVVTDANDNETLVVKVTDPNHRSIDVVGIGDHKNSLEQKSRDYKKTRYSEAQYRIVENRPERDGAAFQRKTAILHFDNKNNGDGTYSYAYETENGIHKEESGVATNGAAVQGGYSYVGDDGIKYSVRYSADENGFRPQGDHLPTPPPVPEPILKALELNARDEAAGIYDDGSYDERKYGGGVNQESAIIFVVANKVKVTKDETSGNNKVVTAASPLPKTSEFEDAADLKHSNNVLAAPSDNHDPYVTPVSQDISEDRSVLINGTLDIRKQNSVAARVTIT